MFVFFMPRVISHYLDEISRQTGRSSVKCAARVCAVIFQRDNLATRQMLKKAINYLPAIAGTKRCLRSRDESRDSRKVEDNNTPNVSDKRDNRISAESGDNGNENRRKQINRERGRSASRRGYDYLAFCIAP